MMEELLLAMTSKSNGRQLTLVNQQQHPVGFFQR